MTPALAWFVGGILLCILETLHWGFVLLWFGIGALVAAAVALLTPEWAWQVGAFAVVSLGLLFSTRSVALRWFGARTPRYTSTIERLIGREAIVTKVIPSARAGAGQVEIDGAYWSALTDAAEDIAEGERVRVEEVDSARLIVQTAVPKGAA